jgi:hypothetical protein
MTITLTRGEAQNVLNLLILWLDEQEEPDTETAIETLRAKLSEPEPEPVAWFTEDHREDKSATTYSKKMSERWKEKGWPVTPLYTAPPQREWVGLTDEEMAAAWSQSKGDVLYRLKPFARAIEAKLKEKNG